MKKKRNKRWELWLIVMALCLGMLTGCGNVEGGGGSAAAAMEETAGKLITVGEDVQRPSNSGGQAGEGGSPQENGTDEMGQASLPGGASGDVMEVHFIDVGQGDATLVKCGGQSLLIDAGEADQGTALQNYLTKQGVERLDYLILTHPDSDHIGGAPVIITKFEIGRVLMSNYEKDNKTYLKLIQALDNKRLKSETPEPGSTFTLGSAVCTVLAPNDTYEDPNNASVAVMIQNGENRFLFTGDAEEEAEKDILENGLDIQADVYQAGHHGSRTSSSEEFLDAVNPRFAVISCEEGNSYGHPHAQTLNNLRARAVEVYRTDEQGSLVAVSDGSEITWNAAPSDTWKAGEPTGSSDRSGNKETKSAGVPAKDEGGNTNPSVSTVQDEGSNTKSSGASAQDEGGNKSSSAPAVQNGSGKAEKGNQGEAGQENTIADEPAASNHQTSAVSYVLNTKTMKFHVPSCGSLPTANRADSDLSREEIIAQGYEPCKKCNP